MKLLRQIVEDSEGKEPTSAAEIIAHMDKVLKGEKVKAFGKDSSGFWGESDEEKEFEIVGLTAHHFEKPFGGKIVGTLDLHLKGYHAKDNGLIYTDKKFEKDFRQLLKNKHLMRFIKKIDYSEQGMQGKNFVNFDLELKVPKK